MPTPTQTPTPSSRRSSKSGGQGGGGGGDEAYKSSDRREKAKSSQYDGRRRGSRQVEVEERPLVDGFLPEDQVAPLRGWLHALAADQEQCAAVVRQTLTGALGSLEDRVAAIAAAVEEQARAATALREAAAAALDFPDRNPSCLGCKDIENDQVPTTTALLESAQASHPNQQNEAGVGAAGTERLDQVVFRPVPSLSPYRTPLDGLYLGSAATFPGGSAHGVPGDAAARAALADQGALRRSIRGARRRLRTR